MTKRNWWSWLSWGKQAPKARGRTHGFIAGYSDGLAAGKRDRLTDDWQPNSLSPTSIHRMHGNLLLRRARDLVENNPFARSAVESYTHNVVGCGITPKPLFDDAEQRRKWVDAWNWWGGEYENEADVTGDQHIYELMALWLTEVIVGGGCLVHYKPLDPDQHRHQRVKLALDLLPEERFADEQDDFLFFLGKKKSGNPITRGVEFDAATGRAVAYWVKPGHPSDGGSAYEPIRLPAEQCRYSFFKGRSGQRRGWSLLKTAVIWLHRLGFYVDNEMMASAIKSCFAAGITTDGEDDDFAGLTDDSDSVVTDVNGNPLEKLEPGIFFRLRGKDSKIHGVGPNTPGSDQEAWILLIERSIAIGLGLSYEGLTRDYSRGSFSSVRAGMNEDRMRYRPLQRFVINHFCRPTYARFVNAASMAGLDGFPRASQLVSNLEEMLRCKWRTPGWASVNPFDDSRSAVLEIDNGLSTRERYAAERGDDWEEIDEQCEREAASERTRGLNYGKPGSVDTAGPGEAEREQQQNQTPAARRIGGFGG
jgi:lambda family phage portal protein